MSTNHNARQMNMEYAADMHTVYTERKKKRERQHRNLLNNLWPQLDGKEGEQRDVARSCFIILLHVSI